jgi:phosphatidylethanolamine/phosphatidyl-N-methylethanolamine N-methyltransferase
MALLLKQKLSDKFEADIRFFKGWLDGPKTVGTPFATSLYTGRAMASVIDPQSGLPVLEVGPGTGTITREILARGIAPENLHAVEYSENFAAGLRCAFPGKAMCSRWTICRARRAASFLTASSRPSRS